MSTKDASKNEETKNTGVADLDMKFTLRDDIAQRNPVTLRHVRTGENTSCSPSVSRAKLRPTLASSPGAMLAPLSALK